MKVKNCEGREIDIMNAHVEAYRAKGTLDIMYFVHGTPICNLCFVSTILKSFLNVEEALDYVDVIIQQLEQENCPDE